MANGPGYTDDQGVWRYGEDDDETLASDLLNLGQASVSEQFALDRARLNTLEADTGWVNATLAPQTVVAGVPARYRLISGLLFMQGRLTQNGSALFILPVGRRPSVTHRYLVAVGTTGSGVAPLVVSTDGTVYTVQGATVNLSLPPFPAEQ